MIISYYILNPTGNITLLVETPLEKSDYKTVADRLMAMNPEAEQAGFIGCDEKGYFLNMAGGEFCGNATLSAAAVFAEKEGIKPGEKREITVNVSGAEKPVNVTLSANENGGFSGTVEMPPAKRIITRDFELEGEKFRLPVVEFGGISHIIFEGVMQKEKAEKAVVRWGDSLGAGCLGIMFADFKNGALSPLVYARDAGTLFWESSCASGTAAAGIYLAGKAARDIDISLKEPGGTLRIKADKNKAPLLSGTVKKEKYLTVRI
ncbi:MAG: hypothetical protein II702_10720 [Clostridia bacterium]|nr:hypothetical protein [Clostridia bacterium]